MVLVVVGMVAFAQSVELRRETCIVRPRCAVTLTFLATICCLACVFYVCVLFQWMRDTQRKTTTRPGMDSDAGEPYEKKRPHIVGSGRAADRQNRIVVRSDPAPRMTEGSCRRGPGCPEGERIAQERIARSLTLVKKR
jgi:hypothetical protein